MKEVNAGVAWVVEDEVRWWKWIEKWRENVWTEWVKIFEELGYSEDIRTQIGQLEMMN
jgi:hypothetical protein